jgi:hypothetical protein
MEEKMEEIFPGEISLQPFHLPAYKSWIMFQFVNVKVATNFNPFFHCAQNRALSYYDLFFSILQKMALAKRHKKSWKIFWIF